MAGRGRGMTVPAWMKDGGLNSSAGSEKERAGGSREGRYDDDEEEENGRGEASNGRGRYDDAPPSRRKYDDDEEDDRSSSRRTGRSDSRRRDHSSSPISRSRGGGRDIDRDSRSRSRSRSRNRGERRKRRSRSRSGGRSSRRRSPSRSRSDSGSPKRRRRERKKRSNFDVAPTGINAEKKAADLINQTLYGGQTSNPSSSTSSSVTSAAAIASLLAAGGGGGVTGLPPALANLLPALANMGALNTQAGGLQAQQTRHARRMYVGGVSDVPETELRDFFNDAINKSLDKPVEGGAVVSVYINSERHFAFIELKSIELTTACVNQMDGILFRGNPVKIKRPTDYQPHLVPPDTPPPPTLDLTKLGIVPSNVPDGPNKIFVGGLPYHLNEEQVKELLTAFGSLKAFHLVKEAGSMNSKGYAFCEYDDPTTGQIACQGLNGMALGGKTLTVRNAMSSSSGDVSARPAIPGLMSMNPMAQGAQAALQFALGGLGAGAGVVAVQGTPTKVLVLLNMVTPEELLDDKEYEDIVDDVRDEVGKFGQVLSLIIPRPPAGTTDAAAIAAIPAIGKIFIEYAEASSSQKAAQALQGRQFAGRIVQASFYDEEKFSRSELV